MCRIIKQLMTFNSWIPGFINPRIIYLPRPSGLGKYNVSVLINHCIHLIKSH